MNSRDGLISVPTVTAGDWATRLLRRAALHAPPLLTDRLEEEWLAHLSEITGVPARYRFALGCYWAAMTIAPLESPVPIAATARTVANSAPISYARRPLVPTALRSTPAPQSVLCAINITPLIDVMLVLVVALIMSLPLMTHAVKLDLPIGTVPQLEPTPEVIDLTIDFDGVILWNGKTVETVQALEQSLRLQSRKDPQPEIRLHPDKRAKYAIVAQVLAAAQRQGMTRLNIANTAEFHD